MMSNWVRFTDRLPAETDCDGAGYLFVMDENGDWETTTIIHTTMHPEAYKEYFWLENVPELPKPRTLEDVARELHDNFLDLSLDDIQKLAVEMKEILEGKDNE